MPQLTRRELIRLLGGAAALAKLPACSVDAAAMRSSRPTRRAMLLGFADVVIPRDDTPGGADARRGRVHRAADHARSSRRSPRSTRAGRSRDARRIPTRTACELAAERLRDVHRARSRERRRVATDRQGLGRSPRRRAERGAARTGRRDRRSAAGRAARRARPVDQVGVGSVAATISRACSRRRATSSRALVIELVDRGRVRGRPSTAATPRSPAGS